MCREAIRSRSRVTATPCDTATSGVETSPCSPMNIVFRRRASARRRQTVSSRPPEGFACSVGSPSGLMVMNRGYPFGLFGTRPPPAKSRRLTATFCRVDRLECLRPFLLAHDRHRRPELREVTAIANDAQQPFMPVSEAPRFVRLAPGGMERLQPRTPVIVAKIVGSVFALACYGLAVAWAPLERLFGTRAKMHSERERNAWNVVERTTVLRRRPTHAPPVPRARTRWRIAA